jgi:hypothetical protein
LAAGIPETSQIVFRAKPRPPENLQPEKSLQTVDCKNGHASPESFYFSSRLRHTSRDCKIGLNSQPARQFLYWHHQRWPMAAISIESKKLLKKVADFYRRSLVEDSAAVGYLRDQFLIHNYRAIEDLEGGYIHAHGKGDR